MKKYLIISLLLLFSTIEVHATKWTITVVGASFSPSTITITSGDSVLFSISTAHNAVEVSQATWNANGNTSLSGGFSTPFGGGLVLPSNLTVGTHYYVCAPHASIGMKGIIIVQACSVPAQPTAISGNASICLGSSNTYSIAAVSGATSYTWAIPSGWTGSSTTTSITSIAGSIGGNITVKANNACGSSAVQTKSVTVNSIPSQPGAISGNAIICSATSNTYSITAISGATSYIWTMPAGWTGSSTTTSFTPTASSTSGNITVKANNTCGSSIVQTKSISVNTAPIQPGAISGNATICEGSSNTYSIASVSGATSYNWVLPLNWTGSSSVNSISTLATANSGDITVSASNSCGSSSMMLKNIIVTAIPPAPSGSAAQTFSEASTVADLVANGNSLIWYDAPTGGSTYSPNDSLVNGTTYYASQTLSGCESQSRLAVTVTIESNRTVILHFFLSGLFNNALNNMNHTLDGNTGEPYYAIGVVDKIKIDLFEETTPFAPVGVSISNINLSPDGLATFTVPRTYSGNYYIRVSSRNHLATWTALPIPFNTTVVNYDFTIDAFQAYGSNPQILVNINPNLYAFFLGDLDNGGWVDSDDFNLFEPDLTNGVVGFYNTDFNGGGWVDSDDFNLFEPCLTAGYTTEYPGKK